MVVIEKMIKAIENFYDKHSTGFGIVGLLIGVVSLFLGVGSLFLAIWISKQPVTLPKKELSCITTNSRSLVLMLNSDSNLKLMYGDNEVSNPCITSIVIQNTGSYPIDNSDFMQPFSVIFGDTDKILSINIEDCSNEYIRDEIVQNSTFSSQKLTIDSFMLNPGEMFTIDIISDGGIPNIKFDQRLEGISQLNLVNESSKRVLLVEKK